MTSANHGPSRAQHVVEPRERLRDAVWVSDQNSVTGRTDQGEGHGYPVITVRVDCGRNRSPGDDPNPVLENGGGEAHFCETGCQ